MCRDIGERDALSASSLLKAANNGSDNFECAVCDVHAQSKPRLYPKYQALSVGLVHLARELICTDQFYLDRPICVCFY